MLQESLVMTKSDPTPVKAPKTEEKEVDLRKTKKIKFGQVCTLCLIVL